MIKQRQSLEAFRVKRNAWKKCRGLLDSAAEIALEETSIDRFLFKWKTTRYPTTENDVFG